MTTRLPKNPEKFRREAGFTLLEVMAATAVMAMTALVIAASLHAFQRSWSRGEKAAAELERNRAVDRIADELFRNAVPLQWHDELNSVEYVFKGEPEELWVAALGRALGDGSPFRFARLYLEDGELRCDYAATPLLPWIDLRDQTFETLTIASGVRSIRFSYADDAGDSTSDAIEFFDFWEKEEHDNFPLAVQLTVEWMDGSRERWLRRTAGSSFNTELVVPTPVRSAGGSGNPGGPQ